MQWQAVFEASSHLKAASVTERWNRFQLDRNLLRLSGRHKSGEPGILAARCRVLFLSEGEAQSNI
jgi:hypothetical protein